MRDPRLTRRVLYLHPHFTLPGGAGRHALETGKVLSDRGWEVHIASIAHRPELIAGFDNFIKFHTLGGPLSNSIWYWPHLPLLLRQVFKCIDSVQPDIIFSQVFPANWWGFIAKLLRGSRVRHIWMCQEPSAFIHSQRWIDSLPYSATGIAARFANPLLKVLDVRFARHVDYVFANSRFSRQLALTAYSYPPEQVGICYPGVDITRFTPSTAVAKERFKFITCARLTRFKNIDRIIKALLLLNDPRITLTIIGRGEEYEPLRQLTHSLALTYRVTFLQTVSDAQMIEELRSSYGLIHAAEEEPFGLTPVEAMACGTPVIAMRGGGPAETVIHETTGYLCSDSNESTIAEAIRWLIHNEPEADRMRSACVRQAQGFTWDLAATSLERVFAN
ncbi:MAG: glycosyltransferase family 4 protein [Pseudomonadota bacterium]|jgi:glycosyltransferase involved in cell wall biosynthesis